MRNMRSSTIGPICGLILLIGVGSIGGCSTGDRTYEPRAQGYVFWPAAPSEPRIQFVRSFRNSRDLSPQKESAFDRMIFGEESDADQAGIDKPYGIDIHDGKIYVCDIRAAGIVVFDLNKEQMRLVGVRGINRLTHPVDVTIADDGWIYVADNEANRIAVFSPDERYAKTYGRPEMNPVSVAVGGDVLYVCDLEAQRVEMYDRHTGKPRGHFGEVGDEDGQFRTPLCVEVDKDGFVYVADMMQSRVQKFTPDGEFVGRFGQLGDTSGSFARPKQLAIDGKGNIFVVDAAFQNVQIFNSEFELLTNFGGSGTFPGAMNLPVGVSTNDEIMKILEPDIHPGFDAYGIVAVTNQFGMDSVAVYALGDLRDGWTVEQISAATITIESGEGQSEEMKRLQSDDTQSLEEEEPAADDAETDPAPDAATEQEPNG